MTLQLRKPDNVGEQDKEVTFPHPLYYSYFHTTTLAATFKQRGQNRKQRIFGGYVCKSSR